MGNLFDNGRSTGAMGVASCRKVILLGITSVWNYMFRLQPDVHMLNKESEPAGCTEECIPEL